ncbi:MAG: malonate decarboxylase holo-[acyl-carrier-protein] synthase [Rhodoferax sp.]|nr:malonate decarboxylase holo-[acyl-carrier-protein] synthase [Rhodoferax sp.]
MKNLVRNHLVWIDTLAWQQIEARDWDAQAREILTHWRAHSLPLVVCRQRDDARGDELCVGLPAPSQWSRRRLALRVRLDQIKVSGVFPTLLQVARANRWGRAALELSLALSSSGVDARVYGSHGWQFLTGLAYLHAESDIDLSLKVDDFETACQLVQQLAATEFPRRIDGEIVFATGEAIAWRELQKLVAGQTAQVMVKERCSIRLAAMTEVSQFGHGVPALAPETVLALN